MSPAAGGEGIKRAAGRRRAVKGQVLALLQDSPDLAALLAGLAPLPAATAVQPLIGALCRPEPLLRWRSVLALGVTVARLADADLEAGRVVMRRLMWSLNDESGGIGWGAPEAMAEIMTCHADLAAEFGHMLVAYMREDGSFLEHEGLQAGLLWGLGRLAAARPQLLRRHRAEQYLPGYLRSPRPELRGLAARALGLLAALSCRQQLVPLSTDPAPFLLFTPPQLEATTVAAQARLALERLADSSFSPPGR
ncbi:MAG: DVU0298 family protein [Thermodesulfobacteriota bacterium]